MLIPLIGAAASVAGGVAAMGGIAAITAGTVALTAGTVMGGLMIAGGAMTAVGALTKNQKLMKYGGVISLVGGIGALATGAWTTGANELAGQAAVDSVAAGTSDIGVGALSGTSGEVAAGIGADAMAGAVGDLGAPIGGAGFGAQPPAGMYGALDAPQELLSGPVPAATAAPGQLAAPPPSTIPPQTPGITPPSLATSDLSVGAVKTGGAQRGLLQSLFDAPSDALKWATKSDANARLAQGGMQAVGMIGKGIGDNEAIKTEIKLREEALQRARDRLNASVAGVQMPVYRG